MLNCPLSSFTNTANAARISGFNANRAEELKRDKYEADLDQIQMTFSPFIMESLGGFGAACDPVISKIGRALADVDKITPSQAAKRLKKRLQCRWMIMLGAALAAQATKFAEV